jgi:hypothetical protein
MISTVQAQWNSATMRVQTEKACAAEAIWRLELGKVRRTAEPLPAKVRRGEIDFRLRAGGTIPSLKSRLSKLRLWRLRWQLWRLWRLRRRRRDSPRAAPLVVTRVGRHPLRHAATAVTSHTRGSSEVSAEHVRMCCSPMPWRDAPRIEDRNKTGEGKSRRIITHPRSSWGG